MKNFILDIDGTLWDSTEVVAVGWNRALKETAVPELKDLVITADSLKKEFGKPMDVIADDLFGPIDADKKTALLKLCCKYEHEAIVNNTKDITFPGVRETLRALAGDDKHGKPGKCGLYIVSNCQNGYIELVMEKNGITDIIRDFECFGRTGLQKSENIKLVIERNGLDDVYYVGDTAGDFDASKKAGVKFIFASYGFGDVTGADYEIKQFADLLKLV